MQAPWNQWGNSVPPNTTGYGAPSYPNAIPPAVGPYPLGPTNPYPGPPAPSLNTTAPPSAVNPQFSSMQQQQQHWQQQQQWEQWQQQYAQWHQQYGDKYTGPLPTPLLPTAGGPPVNNFTSMPPLPQGAPSVQPPPPDSVPPPSDKSDDKKRSLQDAGGKEETKKQKTGKGSKSDNLEDLIEQEKTFDAQFKSWEASFLQWKDQNANHPDKAQYKEYEAKWENWREQLLQKREQLRKKRETKEAEVAAAAAAAKEAALATSSISTVQQAFTTNAVTQSNPYMPTGMMYPNYMSNYPMFSMPPPPALPQMSVMPPLVPPPDSQKNMHNSSDRPPSTQSLEFLSSSTGRTNAKSIPGLDLVGGADRNLPPPIMSTLPPNSSMFNYNHNQDVTKPLHTSDDKPFNFPQPPLQSNYPNDNHVPGPYSRRCDSGIVPGNNPGRNPRFPPHDDRFGRQNDSRFNNDFQYRSSGRGGASDNKSFRNESAEKYDKFSGSSSSYTPNFSSEKFAKYYEDEYDDSRFRDPEPENESYDRFQGRNEYGQNFNSNYKQNFGRESGNENSFNRNNEGSNKRGEFGGNNKGGFDRTRNDFKDNRGSFDRGWQNNNRDSKFGGNWNSQYGNEDNGKNNFGRNDFKNTPKKFDNADNRTDSGRPISLLDLPPMKPPDVPSNFDKNKSFSDNCESSAPLQQSEDKFKQFPNKNNRFTNFKNESDQNFHTEKESMKSFTNSTTSAKPIPPNFVNDENIDKPPPPPPPPPQPPQIVDFIPEKIFEYDHISRIDDDMNAVFEPIYVFDYSHGKNKPNNFINDLIASTTTVPSVTTPANSSAEAPNSGDGSWDRGTLNEVDAKEMSTGPLPQRTRPISESKNDIVDDEPRNDKDLNFKDIVEIDDMDDVPSAPSLSNRNENRRSDDQKKEFDMFAVDEPEKSEIVLINDLLYPPGRHSRPLKVVIIMRGPPGSGKTFMAKLIKDKEVEVGGSAPRILSLDDYFMVENDVEMKDPVTGRVTTKKEMQYEYEAELESSYHESLVKSFKKTVSDGFFPFIIVDCVNDKVKKYEEMWSFATLKGFKPFICEMEMDLTTCMERNVHNRNKDEISQMIKEWEKTPTVHTLVDIRSLLQSTSIDEAEMVDISDDEEMIQELVNKNDDSVENTQENEAQSPKAEENEEKMEDEEVTENDESKNENDVETDVSNEGLTSYMEVFCTSKWEKMENTEEKLDRLDGVAKKRSTSIKEWLQLSEEGEGELSWYTSAADTKSSSSGDPSVVRKKRVRWADLEERVAQQRMRAIGFVVGQTDWKRMMDPSCGGNALTKTKYIYN